MGYCCLTGCLLCWLVSNTGSSVTKSPGYHMSKQQDPPFHFYQLTVLILAPMQGASTAGKATQRGKTSNKKAAVEPARKKKPVVLSSGSESEEEEEESSSEDEAEGLEIERVLHGRPNPDTKQEEFLVKLKGDSVCK